jgi:hemolysin activation/secretion protein
MRFRSVFVIALVYAGAFAGMAQGTAPPAVIEDLFAPPLPAATKAPAAGATLNVRAYQVAGNTVLPPDNFGVLTNYTGTNVDFPRLREGLVKLQQRYRELGYATVSVTLPPQKLTNGVVQVKVVEGRLSSIKISGNRYFSAGNIRRALPSLSTNVLLNSKWFQPELDEANANRDRQIYPVLAPGPDPGTTELTLDVKDRLPLHGRVEVNDKSQPDTPLLRVDTALEYDNLWQHEQQIGVDYNFSPQDYKPADSVHGFYDLPQVTSYSGFYRLPLDFDAGEREELEQQSPTFGYDEITHQFNLPPPTGHPDLTFYGSRSVSASPLRYGPLAVIFTNELAGIRSQSAEQSFTYNNNAGTKFNYPLPVLAGVRSSFSLGVDFKAYEAPSYSTNLTYFDLYGKDALGNVFLITNKTITLPSNSRASLDYVPISWGWAASRPDPWGSFALSYSQSLFLSGLASARTNFQVVAGAPDAGGTYTTVNAGLAREQRLFAGWSALLNVSGQWASAPLINNEQFALGGTGGVRGYQQGEIYGDDGWRAMFDLRAPPVSIGNLPTRGGYVPAQLRCSWFMDYGQAVLIDRPVSETSTEDLLYSQWGTGLGFFLTVGEHFDARLTLAWALLGTPTTGAGTAQAYFSVGAQF